MAVRAEMVDDGDPSEPWAVRIEDSDYPDFDLRFSYAPLSLDASDLALVGVSVRSRALTPRSLTVTEIRDMRMGRWERTARGLATQKIGEMLAPLRQQVDRNLAVMEAVLLRHPELKDAVGTRRMNAQVRLAEVAKEYTENVIAGLADPVAEIARRHDVKPGTARAWVFRSRKEGYLGPALAGPTASLVMAAPPGSINDIDQEEEDAR